jgi:hypothetical protein
MNQVIDPLLADSGDSVLPPQYNDFLRRSSPGV